MKLTASHSTKNSIVTRRPSSPWYGFGFIGLGVGVITLRSSGPVFIVAGLTSLIGALLIDQARASKWPLLTASEAHFSPLFLLDIVASAFAVGTTVALTDAVPSLREYIAHQVIELWTAPIWPLGPVVVIAALVSVTVLVFGPFLNGTHRRIFRGAATIVLVACAVNAPNDIGSLGYLSAALPLCFAAVVRTWRQSVAACYLFALTQLLGLLSWSPAAGFFVLTGLFVLAGLALIGFMRIAIRLST